MRRAGILVSTLVAAATSGCSFSAPGATHTGSDAGDAGDAGPDAADASQP